jgi:hypothetical protein
VNIGSSVAAKAGDHLAGSNYYNACRRCEAVATPPMEVPVEPTASAATERRFSIGFPPSLFHVLLDTLEEK